MAKRSRQVNPIDVVEHAYDLEATDSVWLANLATAVRPLLDGGHGLISYLFDARTTPDEWHDKALLLDIDRAELPHLKAMVHACPDIVELVHFNYDGLLALAELSRRSGVNFTERDPIAKYFARTGQVDQVALQTVEPGGRGVVFSAGQSTHRTFDHRARRLWGRVTTHIAAGRRLRAAIAEQGRAPKLESGGPVPTGAVEAVLTPSGRVEHAEGDSKPTQVRAALRDAVLRQERARGRARRDDPQAATDAWSAMVAGKWSLVDRFERGGRRYVVARRNEHGLSDPRGLTPRERVIAHLAAFGKPNKLIGYELGLAESTVGSHLSTIMRKLGVASRVELIRMVLELGRAARHA